MLRYAKDIAMKYLLPCLLLMVLAGCTPSGVVSIEREDLFSLELGSMEDQIALYGFEGDGRIRHVELAMRDGFFYIADNHGGKMVRYNSYGNLLFMIYNDERNPDPISLKIKADDGGQATRWAFTYPLKSPGKIAVDSRKHIYIEELLPRERHSFDEENKAQLDSVVLHFDADGRFIEHLGQGGQGGGPFPAIVGLYSSLHDELAVVCRLPTGWNTYWYSAQGEQLFLVQIRNDAIPEPPHWSGLFASVDAIIAAPDARKLYIKVDYYQEISDESTNTRTSIESVNSLLWILDVEKGIYESSVEVPLYEYNISEKSRMVSTRLPYFMLGLVRGGGVLFLFPEETGYATLRMNSNGHAQRRGFIKVDHSELQLNDFHLSPEGILSALLVDDWKINVVWWRLDRFMRDM